MTYNFRIKINHITQLIAKRLNNDSFLSCHLLFKVKTNKKLTIIIIKYRDYFLIDHGCQKLNNFDLKNCKNSFFIAKAIKIIQNNKTLNFKSLFNEIKKSRSNFME